MRILKAIYQDPAYHPPVHFSAQMLAERGHQVTLIARTPNALHAVPGDVDYGAGTRVRMIGAGRDGLGDKIDFLRFAWRLRHELRTADHVVCYNYLALSALKLAGWNGKPALTYHNLDWVDPTEVQGFVSGYLKSLEVQGIAQAQLVLASSEARAKRIEVVAGIRGIKVVKNAQRNQPLPAPTGGLSRILQAKQLAFRQIVVRLGQIAPKNAIEATLRSVPFWPSDAGFVVAGLSHPGYLSELRSLIKALNIESRVLILEAVPYALWYDILQAADIGSALYEPHDFGNQSMAGAGNKLNLYLRAQLPCLLPKIPDFEAFAATYPTGLLVDPSSPEDIGRAVCQMLSQPLDAMRKAAERAFVQEYCFDIQYRCIVDLIEAPSPLLASGQSRSA